MVDVYNLIGIIGAFFILVGLYRTTRGKWSHHSLWYELDHAAGSTLLIIYLWHEHAYIGIVINIAYLLASIIGLSSYAERRMGHRRLGHKKSTSR